MAQKEYAHPFALRERYARFHFLRQVNVTAIIVGIFGAVYGRLFLSRVPLEQAVLAGYGAGIIIVLGASSLIWMMLNRGTTATPLRPWQIVEASYLDDAAEADMRHMNPIEVRALIRTCRWQALMFTPLTWPLGVMLALIRSCFEFGKRTTLRLLP